MSAPHGVGNRSSTCLPEESRVYPIPHLVEALIAKQASLTCTTLLARFTHRTPSSGWQTHDWTGICPFPLSQPPAPLPNPAMGVMVSQTGRRSRKGLQRAVPWPRIPARSFLGVPREACYLESTLCHLAPHRVKSDRAQHSRTPPAPPQNRTNCISCCS